MWNRGHSGVSRSDWLVGRCHHGGTMDIYAFGFVCFSVGVVIGLVVGGLCGRWDARAVKRLDDVALPPGRPSTYTPPAEPPAHRGCGCSRGLSMEDL